MGFLDLIGELRTANADVQKAARAMKALGWVCTAGAVWNYIMYYVGRFDEWPFYLSEAFPYLALGSGLIVGALFFRAARGIRELEPWGKRTGQLAIILTVAILLGSALIGNPLRAVPNHGHLPSFVFGLFFVIVLGHFAMLAYCGTRYLGRLPAKDDPYAAGRYRSMSLPQPAPVRLPHDGAASEAKYKDSPFPFGVTGTFLLSFVVLLLPAAVALASSRLDLLHYAFVSTFAIIFCAPIAYNYWPSPFQDGRTLLASYTGGGSIFLFGASWPFFRLMVYEDGVEVRVEFHRFFIPYSAMGEVPAKVGLFSTGILIASDLPGVPSKIRFSGFGMKRIAKRVGEAKAKWPATRSA